MCVQGIPQSRFPRDRRARGARAGAGGFGARGPEAERRGQLASGSPHGRPPHVQAPALTGGSPAPARAACGTGSNSRGGR